MIFRRHGILHLIIFSAALFSLDTISHAQPTDDLRKQVQEATKGFIDLRMDVTVGFQDQKELQEIGKDYGMAYQFKESKVIFKSPDKYKAIAKAGLINVTYVVVGNKKTIKAGIIHKNEDISQKPHHRQTTLDVGIVDGTLWRDYTVEKAQREGQEYVVTLSLWNSPAKKQHVWIDSRSLQLIKRERYEADGSLIARYIYSDHRKYNGIWVPGALKVYSRDGDLAGSVVYTKIQINSGVKEDEFK